MSSTPSSSGPDRSWTDRLQSHPTIGILSILAAVVTVVVGAGGIWALLSPLAEETPALPPVAADGTEIAEDVLTPTTSPQATTSTTLMASPSTESTAATTSTAVSAIETRDTDEISTVCAQISVEAPPEGSVEPGAFGCPTLTAQNSTPGLVQEWQFQLVEGQQISFSFDINVNNFEAELLDPSGLSIASLSRFEAGKFTADITGKYEFTLKGDPNVNSRYSLRLVDVSVALEDERSFSAGAFDCRSEPIIPIGIPPSGDVEPGDTGCPVMSGLVDIPYIVHLWRIELAEGDLVSYSFSTNVNNFEATLIDPNGDLIAEFSRFDNGDFQVATSGQYLFVVAGDPRVDTRYSLGLMRI